MKKKKSILKILLLLICIIIVSIIFSGCFLDPNIKIYTEANELYESGEYKEAANIFAELGEYKDSPTKQKQSLYAYAGQCFENHKFDEAINIFDSIRDYLDSSDRKKEVETEIIYLSAVDNMDNSKYDTAKNLFESIINYKNSEYYVVKIIYTQAVGIINSNPDNAVEMLVSIKDYDNEEIIKSVNEALINKALSYIDENLYEKAVDILEKISTAEKAAELLELYNKYNQAVIEFNKVEEKQYDSVYLLFTVLGDFSDSKNYVIYIEADRDAKAERYGEAAEKYFSVWDFLDSKDLFGEYAYLYYDAQYKLGNHDLYSLSLMPLNAKIENYFGKNWRNIRVENLKKIIENTENLANYYNRNDILYNPVTTTGTGIYINESFNKYGVDILSQKIIEDMPIFFLSDSPENIRYIVNFTGYAEIYGIYGVNGTADGTFAYKTTTTVTIKDIVTSQIVFTKSYTAEPPTETTQSGDVYGMYDYLTKLDESGKSAYERDILPVLLKLCE